MNFINLYFYWIVTHLSHWCWARYEAFVCKGKQSEKVPAGQLEHLLPHIPAMSDLYDKGCDANFDLKLPENLHGAEWFSKATVKRFLSYCSLFYVFSFIFYFQEYLTDNLILFFLPGSCILLVHQIW